MVNVDKYINEINCEMKMKDKNIIKIHFMINVHCLLNIAK